MIHDQGNRHITEPRNPDFKSVSYITSEEHVSGLRRVRDSVPWRLWVVLMIAFWERAAFWGLTAPWRKYSSYL
ncbi:hypothetical protein GQ44DRAFT_717147, partial [Phaeosphaeriaceae sp. PMI808]